MGLLIIFVRPILKINLNFFDIPTYISFTSVQFAFRLKLDLNNGSVRIDLFNKHVNFVSVLKIAGLALN